jgi:transcriptional regulator with XRE-family HTH domain
LLLKSPRSDKITANGGREMIDSAWFYQQLQQEGRSLRDMARALGMDASAVSRMLRGERKMSADEQDGIATYLGLSLGEVAMRRRGEIPGFGEQAQEALNMDVGGAGDHARKRSDTDLAADVEKPGSLFERIRSKMAGTVTVMPGVDLTEPADPEWARVYDDDYDYPIHR